MTIPVVYRATPQVIADGKNVGELSCDSSGALKTVQGAASASSSPLTAVGPVRSIGTVSGDGDSRTALIAGERATLEIYNKGDEGVSIWISFLTGLPALPNNDFYEIKSGRDWYSQPGICPQQEINIYATSVQSVTFITDQVVI